MLHPAEVAVSGITYVPKWYQGKLKSIKHTDKVRGDLILYSLKFASAVGYRVVIVDSGSSKTFIREAKKVYGVKVLQARSRKRSPNRRKSIFECAKIDGIKAIISTEIEKVSLITDCIPQCVRPVLKEDAFLVVPKREDSLFKKSYPDYMYESESEGNFLYNEELKAHGLLSKNHEDLDMFFGPRVYKNDKKFLKQVLSMYKVNIFDSKIARRLFDVEQYSDAQFFPVIKAMNEGYKVVSTTIPFLYPEAQKMNELVGERELFIMKRRFQRLTILVELMHFLEYLEKRRGRKMVQE